MSGIKGLLQRVNRMKLTIDLANAPKLIECTAEVDQLLAELEHKIREEGGNPDEPTDLSFLEEPWVKELDEALEQSVREMEELYNIRLVA